MPSVDKPSADAEDAPPPPGLKKWASAAAPASPARRAPCVAPKWHDTAQRRGFRRRPDVWSVKTRQLEWADTYSRWRYVSGYLFALGPPHHLLRRIWVPLALNSFVFGLVAADHITESVSTAHGRTINLFPKLSPSVVANLTPIFQLSLLAVSLMLTQRVGRVYDRWLESRKNLAIASTWVVMAAQRAVEWGDMRRADAIARWSVAWFWLLIGWLGDEPQPAPVLDQLLSRGELGELAKARKPRALAFRQVCRLLGGSGAGDFMVDKLGELTALLEATKRQGIPSGVANLSTGFVLFFTGLYPLTALPPASPALHDVDLDSVLFTLALEYFLYVIICVLFLGADEMANSMEDCFLHLPLREIAVGATRDVQEALDALVALPAVDGIGQPVELVAGSAAVWEAVMAAAGR